jgi:hypothetical protein
MKSPDNVPLLYAMVLPLDFRDVILYCLMYGNFVEDTDI